MISGERGSIIIIAKHGSTLSFWFVYVNSVAPCDGRSCLMNRFLKILLIMLLALTCALSLIACQGDGDTEEPDEPTYPEDELPVEGLVLIRKNIAQFKVVIASGAGSEGRRAAGELVDALRSLSVEVADAVEDKNAADMTDCEIIIGVGAKNRSGCSVLASELGDEGYLIKAVGKRIVIAGGTPTLTRLTVKKFMSEQLGIDDDTTSLRNVGVPENLNVFVPTDYSIDKITVSGNDLAGYVISCDENDEAVFPDTVNLIKNKLKAVAGYNLSVVDNRSVTQGARQIIVRTVTDAGEEGFRVYVEEENLIIEASLPTLFGTAVDEFLSATFNGNKTLLAISDSFSYTKNIITVKYADFGAAGDGVTNDFFALLEAHETVNITGQTLLPEGESGNTFYIGKTWVDGEDVAKTIQIRTDMDFKDATFIIDDTVESIHDSGKRTKNIFSVARDKGIITYSSVEGYSRQISTLTESPVLHIGDTSIPWLAEVLTEELYLVRVINSNHKDYVRFGGNENAGNSRCDVLMVDSDGNIAADTPVIFEFDTITEIQLTPVTDTPITVEGGFFKTICAKCADKHKDSQYTEYEAYSRGISVVRPNATVKNIDHEVLNEPDDKSYPYSGGFIAVSGTYNVTVSDCKLSGRKLYYGSKDITTEPVPMGSYDLTMNNSCNTYYKNLTQYRDIKDQIYWGLSASNGCKNLNFDNVVISRIDAHCGLWNIDITNSTIGFAINIIGGGTANITNTTKRTGDSFLYLRDDYGATFNGTINIKDCRMNGYQSYYSQNSSGQKVSFSYTSYYSTVYVIKSGFDPTRTFKTSTNEVRKYIEWDFGYTCYMPTVVNLDNFTAGYDQAANKDTNKTTHTVHVFNNIANSAFNNTSNPYGGYKITDKITYKNMTKPKICPDEASCTTLAGIDLIAK